MNSKLCVTLQDGLESCKACKDRELATLEVGQVFLDNVEFFQAYEIFCVKQVSVLSYYFIEIIAYP